MKKKHALGLLIISFLIPAISNGQGLIKIWEERLPSEPTAYSIDSENNAYLGFANGGLRKFSPAGKEVLRFSIPNQSSITLLEAQNNRKIFLFYRDIQRIVLLDRFSTIPREYTISDFGIPYAESACISPDGTFWIAENNPRILKKIDPLRKIVVHEVQHNLGDSITMMRTFGNLLLIADENGLQILDQFGNHNGTVKAKDISYLHVVKDQVFVTYPAGLMHINPYRMEIVGQTTIEELRDRNAILKNGNKFFVVSGHNMILYSPKD